LVAQSLNLEEQQRQQQHQLLEFAQPAVSK
jgi:hypothetical protein